MHDEGVKVLDVVQCCGLLAGRQLLCVEVDHQGDQDLEVAELSAGQGVFEAVQKLEEGCPKVHLPQIAAQRSSAASSLLIQRPQVRIVEADQPLHLRRRRKKRSISHRLQNLLKFLPYRRMRATEILLLLSLLTFSGEDQSQMRGGDRWHKIQTGIVASPNGFYLVDEISYLLLFLFVEEQSAGETFIIFLIRPIPGL